MGLLRLTRPANVVTAVADILAGIAISGYLIQYSTIESAWIPVCMLALSTIGLYAGGVVFNDVFDAALDKIERPERPIPSGVVTQTGAAIWGGLLLTGGVLAAAVVHQVVFSPSLLLAIAIAVSALIYDKWCKHHFIAGPLTMGLCRGLNLLLGMSILPEALRQYWLLALIPIVYVAAITTASRGEVHGGNKTNLYLAFCLYTSVLFTLLVFSVMQDHWKTAIFFVAGFGFMIIPPLLKAIKSPAGPLIGKAVKAGVLGLILMNAAWAAAFGQLYLAIAIVMLLPASIFLSRIFAVT